MGNCFGDKRTLVINKDLRQAEELDSKKIKILLLGAGESGKTTLFKQMRLLYTAQGQFTPEEHDAFAKNIFRNIIQDFYAVLDAMEKRGLELKAPEAQKALDQLPKPKAESLSPEEGIVLETLWNDETIQEIWENRGDVQVQDALKYFMASIKRITSPDWVPTNQDILRARARTTGVVQAQFTMFKTKFEMYDVGGQRTERKKWMHYFEDVTTVLFVAAISEYNQVLYEDASVNRQAEALELFKKQLEVETFLDTPFILFLNKNDLFREKLASIPFRVADGPNARNVDFEGPHCDLTKEYKWETEGADKEFEQCYTAALRYLTNLYTSQKSPERGAEGQIYPHPTNSTDSGNIQRIMNTCKDIVLREHLQNGGWA